MMITEGMYRSLLLLLVLSLMITAQNKVRTQYICIFIGVSVFARQTFFDFSLSCTRLSNGFSVQKRIERPYTKKKTKEKLPPGFNSNYCYTVGGNLIIIIIFFLFYARTLFFRYYPYAYISLNKTREEKIKNFNHKYIRVSLDRMPNVYSAQFDSPILHQILNAPYARRDRQSSIQ